MPQAGRDPSLSQSRAVPGRKGEGRDWTEGTRLKGQVLEGEDPQEAAVGLILTPLSPLYVR